MLVLVGQAKMISKGRSWFQLHKIDCSKAILDAVWFLLDRCDGLRRFLDMYNLDLGRNSSYRIGWSDLVGSWKQAVAAQVSSS